MTIAFTFPGQGSQSVGMGRELAERFPAARAVFEEVDDALGEKLSELIWEGPEEKLTLTSNAQPALMAVSLAAVRAMQEAGLRLADRVAFAAGHSLGEYSAHAAAGTFSLADTARLLRIRGTAMQEAVPVGQGAMAAIIGLEAEAVERICERAASGGVCQIANDNGGGQLVVSGNREAVEKAAEIAGGEGARRAIMLPVSAPFHCALMEPAADRMRLALEEARIAAPAVPVVANVSARPVTEPAEIADLLALQVTGRVRWQETVRWMSENGVDTLYEIGAGKVLTGLARRIDRELKALPVNTPQDLDQALEALL